MWAASIGMLLILIAMAILAATLPLEYVDFAMIAMLFPLAVAAGLATTGRLKTVIYPIGILLTILLFPALIMLIIRYGENPMCLSPIIVGLFLIFAVSVIGSAGR